MSNGDDPKDYTPEKPGGFFILGVILVVILFGAGTAGILLARQSGLKRQQAQIVHELAPGPRVLVIMPQHTPPTREIELPGNIQGYVESPIYAKIPGYLERILVDKGDRVKRGQLLAVLLSPETDKEVADARANYWLQKITNDRDQELLRQQVIPRQTADNQYSAMLQAYQYWRQLVATQAYEQIISPVDGIVTARYVDVGTLIPQTTTPVTAATPVVAIATLSPVRVYANMPQNLAPFVHNGDRASVSVVEYPGEEFNGTVTRHPEALTPDSRTMLVEVDLPNLEQRLYPGMYARVAITAHQPAGPPQVPDDALVFRDGLTYVPVVRSNHLYLSRVVLGYDNGRYVQVTSGLWNNDMVAINVGQSARNGEPVQPITMNSAGSRSG
jgi:membrane fusion protein, multidrug efflux system